ncbi:MAG: hypothetical protein WA715_20800 [Candidatus Acidiferrum sp.]|jgi:hypothetical protein
MLSARCHRDASRGVSIDLQLRAASVETLAVVVTSRSATLDSGIVSDGATLYNGDFSLLPLAISAWRIGRPRPDVHAWRKTLIDRKSFEIRAAAPPKKRLFR